MADEFSALQAKLLALRNDVLNKAQRKALKQVGEVIKTELVARAPEKLEGARGVLSKGELKASIRVRITVPTDEATVQGRVAKVSVGPGDKEVKLIAADVEYGHSNPKAGPKKKKFTPAHPFVRPAEMASEAAAIETYTTSVSADIEKAMK